MRDGVSRKANPVALLPLRTATEASRRESDSPLRLRGFTELGKDSTRRSGQCQPRGSTRTRRPDSRLPPRRFDPAHQPPHEDEVITEDGTMPRRTPALGEKTVQMLKTFYTNMTDIEVRPPPFYASSGSASHVALFADGSCRVRETDSSSRPDRSTSCSPRTTSTFQPPWMRSTRFPEEAPG